MQIGTKSGLFPLNLIDSSYTGLYMDGFGNLWSTKISSEPKMLKNKFYASIRGRTRGMYSARRQARNHRRWTADTTVAKEPALATSVVNLPSTKKPEGWIIGSLRPDGSLSFSTAPIVHKTEDETNKELARLAEANPGKMFVSLKISKSAVASGVTFA